MDLHPNMAALAGLLGTWRGHGHGSYPTISGFDYDDEWTFAHTGKPFLSFVQRTRISTMPMHTESGYLRSPGPGLLEIVAALPTGQSESGTGFYRTDAGELVLQTDATVLNTPSAKPVRRIVRRFRLEGDRLSLETAMDAVDQGLTRHLLATLERAPGS